jgi:hypothetical protein
MLLSGFFRARPRPEYPRNSFHTREITMSIWQKLAGPAVLSGLGGLVLLLPSSWGNPGAEGDLLILTTTYVKGEVTPCG